MGDLHDIGKNLTGMMVEGAGWEVIDLGTDVSVEKYIQALDEHPGAICGMSALLTTTMSNMQPMIAAIREKTSWYKSDCRRSTVERGVCTKDRGGCLCP